MDNPLAGQPLHLEGAYRLEGRPLGRGGQAEVFPAEHKATGVKVALKRLRSSNVEAVRRMGREIDFGALNLRNDHIMPVFDHGKRQDWFVMPRAEANAEECRPSLLKDDQLTALVFAVCSALEAAHAHGCCIGI